MNIAQHLATTLKKPASAARLEFVAAGGRNRGIESDARAN